MIRLQALNFVYDRMLGKPKQDVSVSGGRAYPRDPFLASLPREARPEVKGRVIAASNLLSFGGIAVQPVAQCTMLRLGHPDPGHVFLICAMACVAMGFLLAWMLPELWPSALYWTRLRQRATL